MTDFHFRSTSNPATVALMPMDPTRPALEEDPFEVIHGGGTCAQMTAQRRDNPAALDRRFAGIEGALEGAVRHRSAL
jgi:uncharacterized oxidoreductase